MDEMKHTPGPWTVDGPPWNQIVWSSAENRVCFLAHSNGLDDERDIATGRLIAASPEMFDLLKRARKILEAQALMLSLAGAGDAANITILNEIDAVIAKLEAAA